MRGDFVRRSDAHCAAFTDIWTLGVLTNDDEVVFRVASRCRAEERSLVDVEVEFEAHLQQQPPLDHPGLHVGMTDGAEVQYFGLLKYTGVSKLNVFATPL